jgi:hypothetical protein
MYLWQKSIKKLYYHSPGPSKECMWAKIKYIFDQNYKFWQLSKHRFGLLWLQNDLFIIGINLVHFNTLIFTTSEDELPWSQGTTGNQIIEGILWNFNEKSKINLKESQTPQPSNDGHIWTACLFQYAFPKQKKIELFSECVWVCIDVW